jgi:hypothetical protein
MALPNSAGFLMESCDLPAPLFLGDSVLLCGSTNTDVRFLPVEPGVHESVSLVAHGAWGLDNVDTIGTFPNRTLIVLVRGGTPLPVYVEPPYGQRGRMGVGGTPKQFVFAPAEIYRIERRGLDPVTRMVIERVGGLRPPTQLEIASLDTAFARRERAARVVGYRAPADDADGFRGMAVDSLSIVAGAPHIDAMNAVWAPVDAPRPTFDIFDAQGIYLGQVLFPTDTLTIYDIGVDYILGVARDEFDVEYVVMFELDRRTSE